MPGLDRHQTKSSIFGWNPGCFSEPKLNFELSTTHRMAQQRLRYMRITFFDRRKKGGIEKKWDRKNVGRDFFNDRRKKWSKKKMIEKKWSVKNCRKHFWSIFFHRFFWLFFFDLFFLIDFFSNFFHRFFWSIFLSKTKLPKKNWSKNDRWSICCNFLSIGSWVTADHMGATVTHPWQNWQVFTGVWADNKGLRLKEWGE